MNTPLAAFIVVAAFLVALAETRLVRDFARRKHLLDHPNDRSSHAVPVPRLGGLAIVAVFLVGALAVASLSGGAGRLALVLAATAVISALGLLDDLRPMRARTRIAVQAAMAMIVVVLSGGPRGSPWLEAIPFPLLAPLLVLWIVWLTNLYNFMDGIDGIAGAEAVCVGLGALLLGGSTGWLLLAAAAGGFLLLNWPPARIFMGDVGSGFLGFALGVLAVDAAGWEQLSLAASAILLGVFLVDATVTLFRRWLRGERLAQAHRSHAYQHAARRYGGHRPVVLATVAVNLLWLLPWAWVAQAWPAWEWVALAVALAPLVVVARWLGAGTGEVRAS